MSTLAKFEKPSGSGLGFEIDVSKVPSRRESLMEISKPAAPIHQNAKRLPPEIVAQAINNEPFEDYPRAVYGYQKVCGEDGTPSDNVAKAYRNGVEAFLRRTYHSLTFVPDISFDISKYSVAKEKQAIGKVIAQYRKHNLDGQVESVENAYEGLQALRTIFSTNMPYGFQTVVPSRYLPDLLTAAPVWFIHTREDDDDNGGMGINNEETTFFSNLVGTNQFAWLYQLYNYQTRRFNEFTGRDIMPLPILNLIEKVKDVFDYLIIATPYHDLAAREWAEARWQRNIDPFLFGFFRAIPEQMFFLGRWSGTGLFPLMGDMIADTMEHLKQHKHRLIGFRDSINWYSPKETSYTAQRFLDGGNLSQTSDSTRIAKHPLIKFADDVLQQFEKGTLFSWLRGENTKVQPASK
jgi:hypothetical protein